jgi:hypothetical protein
MRCQDAVVHFTCTFGSHRDRHRAGNGTRRAAIRTATCGRRPVVRPRCPFTTPIVVRHTRPVRRQGCRDGRRREGSWRGVGGRARRQSDLMRIAATLRPAFQPARGVRLDWACVPSAIRAEHEAIVSRRRPTSVRWRAGALGTSQPRSVGRFRGPFTTPAVARHLRKEHDGCGVIPSPEEHGRIAATLGSVGRPSLAVHRDRTFVPTALRTEHVMIMSPFARPCQRRRAKHPKRLRVGVLGGAAWPAGDEERAPTIRGGHWAAVVARCTRPLDR